MKMQFSTVLFAFVLGCGSDHVTPQVQPPVQSAPPVAMAPGDAGAATPEVTPTVTVKADLVEDAMPTSFDEALAQGRAALAKGEHARARELLEAAAKMDKKRAEPHVELARLFIATSDRGMAIAAANRAVKLAPASTQAWNTKGRAELARFAYDDAIAAFTKAVELNRDNVWAWNNLGFANLQVKKYDDAVEALVQATSRKGATGYMWNNLGTALEQLDRLDEARHAFEEGGKLGSTESVASRKRLEGVKSIAIAKEEQETQKLDEKKGYELNEGRTDEDVKMDAQPGDGSGNGSGSGNGNGSGSGIGSGNGSGVTASDQATN